MKRARRGDEAQSLGFISLFGGVIVAGLLWIVLQPATQTIQNRRANATAAIEDATRRQAAERGADLFDILLGNQLLFVTFVGVFGMIAYTVYLRRGIR